MLHPGLRLQWIGDDVGYGLFATEYIQTGTILWALDQLDQVYSTDAVASLGPRYTKWVERYGYRDAAGDTIVCWDLAKYMNHSCDPNCVGPGHGLFDLAVRPVEPGQEVTTDYACLNLERPMRCACRAERCRGQIRADDMLGIAVELDRRLQRAIPRMAEVPQPLRAWVDAKLFQRTLADPTRSPSVSALEAPER